MDDNAHASAKVEKSADNAKSEMSTEPEKETLTKANDELTKSGNNSKKDSSLEEDLLGANSLLMSDSDDDDSSALSAGKVIGNDEAKICKVISPAKSDTIAYGDNKKIDSNEENTSSPVKIRPSKNKKFSAILDSDSDEENKIHKPINDHSIKTKLSALIDSDSETDDEKNQSAIKNETNSTNKYKIFDFDEEDSESPTSKGQKSKIKNRVVDSDTDCSSDAETHTSANELGTESGNDVELETENQMASGVKKQAQSKQMRASAKKALDDIQAIQSEQQRLHREAHISIPYHKPKKHTLQEFLKRRTIMKPTSDNDCSPAVVSLRKKPLKMSAEELEEYAKLMEDRAKEATEFFKSESESEEGELKPNTGVMDLNELEVAEQQLQEETQPAESVTEDHTKNFLSMQVELEKNEAPVVSLENDMQPVEPMNTEPYEQQVEQPLTKLMETEKSEETDVIQACSTQPIVTEVLELPKLDLSTLHIAEEQYESAPSPSKVVNDEGKIDNTKVSKLNDLLSTESPRLKGDPHMVIDLDSGDLVAKKPTGADNLLQRLLATHKTRKSKTNETVDILSSENGKLEMTKVNYHHHDETEFSKEQKPGAAYLKLKENLKTLIKKKRLEELQKKQEDEDEYNKCLEGDEEDYEIDDDEEDYEIDDDVEEHEAKGDRNVKLEKEKPTFENILIDDEENAVQLNEDDADYEDIEETEPTNEQNDNADAFIDAGAVEADSGDDSESCSDEDDENNDDIKKNNGLITFKEPLTNTQRKSRIIKAFASDSDHDEDDDDDIDLLKTQQPIAASNVITPLFGAIDSPLKKSLSLPIRSFNTDVVGNTQELMELCSGTFDITQKPATTADTETVIISQIPLTLSNTEADTRRELLSLCSGSFDSEQQQTQIQQSTTSETIETESHQQQNSKPTTYKILSSDEEDASGVEGIHNRVRKLRKKIKKGQAKLGFSDDEDELDSAADAEPSSENEADENSVDNAVDMPETYVEYDSEENEIVVEMTKKDCIQRAGNFFEKEAELSESEWSSADEDEKNLDHYDIELGDEDDFDREKLQQELGQIHARKMLDEDIREVRKIQEMLFEDEENDGVGRQRQFRWKNAESGFSLDDINRGEDVGFNGAESGDEEQKQEHLWRKIRYEREQLLKEQGITENSQEFLTAKLGVNSPHTTGKNTATPIIGSNGKKIQIVTKKSAQTTTAQRKGSPFLISSTAKKPPASSASKTLTATTLKPLSAYTPPSTATILQPKTARGSFLMRDKESLTKFANFTKGFATAASLEDDEAAGTVSVKSIKAKNFVFATLTKEEHEHLKRKADDLINSSSENGTNFMKKPRTTNNLNATKGKQCFIDKLLS